jgi:hypothetical protein
MLIRFVCWLLRHKRLSSLDRTTLTNTILDSVKALPIHAIITVNENKIFIRGTELEGERALVIREGAQSALNNVALRTIHEQVLYQAVSLGVHQALTPEQMSFAKAAIWFGEEELKLLQLLAGPTNSSFNGD